MPSFTSRLPTNPNLSSLPKYYGDASTLLSLDKYNRRHSFRPSWISDDEPDHTVSYACVGAEKEDELETVVWLNGLGGNRYAAAFLDGIFAMYRLRLIHIDRPGAGHSTPVPLSHRVEWSTEALLSILSHEGRPPHLSVISHSNGVIYTLHLLSHLPRTYAVRHWFMSSPFVIPLLSGSWSLGLASYLPAPVTGSLGTLASTFSTSLGWYQSAKGVSSGELGGLSKWWGGVPMTSTTAAEAEDPTLSTEEDSTQATRKSRRQYERFVKKQNDLHASPDDARQNERRKTFEGYFFGPDLFNEAMKRAGEEGLGYMGEEALISLRKGEGARWGWPKEGAEGRDGNVYLRGFREWKEGWEKEGRALPRIKVGYGSEDGMIPKRGRDHLKSVLVDQLRLVKGEDWREIRGAGHDDTLGVTTLIEPWCQSVVASAEGH
ncbi:BZ3500_MvSof-1268-A1-R1_Chr5-2g07907 [Microbotryum saponariae]|uniref:BZ3500_MvSof-1268-A1-R1_Chr5-2g07907 protein n=1 Tax=Microbotryum saponariae TaxID=289078 RepID=A0A2X0NJ27_9BASI|nr:BZ3500_MvSof-1268-A1-R1_Chr5-2g07907 [Microbotryum saponariae]SDA05776.1 BZ3501_MvSof-1269-A2-R1_Chr5-2g07729 [Microbotryum saponariae]